MTRNGGGMPAAGDRAYIGKFYLAVKSTKNRLSSGLFVQGSLREKHGVLRYVGGCFGRRLPAMQALYERNVEVIKIENEK